VGPPHPISLQRSTSSSLAHRPGEIPASQRLPLPLNSAGPIAQLWLASLIYLVGLEILSHPINGGNPNRHRHHCLAHERKPGHLRCVIGVRLWSFTRSPDVCSSPSAWAWSPWWPEWLIGARNITVGHTTPRSRLSSYSAAWAPPQGFPPPWHHRL
jgi:hypothetical protein